MDINEAIVHVKQLNSTLEAFKTIEEFLAVVVSAQESFEQSSQTKVDLEADIAEKTTELSGLTVKYHGLSTQLQTKYDLARDAAQESLKTLKENFNKELEETKISSHAKINEFTEKVSGLKVETKNLDREIGEKQEFLASLKKEIDSIRARLT